jgi:twitching motility protein PilT
MRLSKFVSMAAAAQASDLHLEAGLPAALRVRGQLRTQGTPVGARELLDLAREVVGEDRWPELLERRSCDLARTIDGVRCRINVLCTSRGVGLAVRLLGAAQASLRHLNLHPDLARLVQQHHGLVIVSGPTGSGKSSTLAALVQELNEHERRHVVTLESPIEFTLVPRQCFIRQREVGRDTPSFEQGLYDALREDPDVLVVGELRDATTMRLTLEAAETGHLVLATLHSSTCAEALQRLVGAFPAEIQGGIAAQLADCLVAVVCQRLRWFPERALRAPECEILPATQSVKAVVRQGHFFKLQTALETGGAEGCWTYGRYREWLERRTDWAAGTAAVPGPGGEPEPAPTLPELAPPPMPRTAARGAAARPPPASSNAPPADGVLEIHSADDDLAGLVSELERRST